MEYNAMNKAALLEAITKVEAEKAQAELQLKRTVELSSFFESKLLFIEELFNKAAFLQKGKFIRVLTWVLFNFKEVKQLISDIFTHIEEYRQVVNDILRRAKEEELKLNKEEN